MTKIPLSVFVIAKDEEDRIIHTLNSVKDWAAEVFVIDSGSTDQTVSVSAGLGARVVYNEWQGYGPQKVFAESLCQHRWLLNLDADEEVSVQLQKEITSMFENGNTPKASAYHIPIKIMRRFATKPGLWAPSNDPIRLYDKEYAGFKDSLVHDSVVMNDSKAPIGKLKSAVYHRCFRSYSHAVTKINSYSSMQAQDLYDRKVKPKNIRIIFEPFIAFIKAYTLRRYFLLGTDGFIESIIYAFARTLRLAKLREKWQERA